HPHLRLLHLLPALPGDRPIPVGAPAARPGHRRGLGRLPAPPPAHRRPARRPGPRAVAPPLDAAAVRQLRPLRGAETAERAAEAGVMISRGGGGPGGRPPEGPDVPRAAGPRRPGDPMVGTPPPVGQTSVILPTYNEGLVIVDVVREILEAVGDVEVLV